jgi:hypothetical protein
MGTANVKFSGSPSLYGFDFMKFSALLHLAIRTLKEEAEVLLFPSETNALNILIYNHQRKLVP